MQASEPTPFHRFVQLAALKARIYARVSIDGCPESSYMYIPRSSFFLNPVFGIQIKKGTPMAVHPGARRSAAFYGCNDAPAYLLGGGRFTCRLPRFARDRGLALAQVREEMGVLARDHGVSSFKVFMNGG